MKPNFIFVILAMVLVPPRALSDPTNISQENDLVTVNSSSSGITLKVWCRKAFEDNSNVEINYSVFNGTDFPYEMIHANGIHDIEIHLTDPHGKRVLGFHEMKGSRIVRGIHKRFYSETIAPNQDHQGDSIPVSVYWPIKSVGEYKCIVTKTIYRSNRAEQKQYSPHRQGQPFKIVSPEFKFTIKSIDKTFKSRAESMVDSEQTPDKHPSKADNLFWNPLKPDVFNIGMTAVAIALIGWFVIFLRIRRLGGH